VVELYFGEIGFGNDDSAETAAGQYGENRSVHTGD
jgi:hypothetical protein